MLTQDECKEKGVAWTEDQKLEVMNKDILNTIVQNIFRKAQVEKEYTIFYGDICEKFIKLELTLKGMQQTITGMKKSDFRKTLFEVCKDCFEKFFKEEEKQKAEQSIESTVKFT